MNFAVIPENTYLGPDQPFNFSVNVPPLGSVRVTIYDPTGVLQFDKTYTSSQYDSFIDDDGTGFWRASGEYRVVVERSVGFVRDVLEFRIFVRNKNWVYGTDYFYVKMKTTDGNYTMDYVYAVLDSGSNKYLVSGKYVQAVLPVPRGWSVYVTFKNVGKKEYGEALLNNVTADYELTSVYVGDVYKVRRVYRVYKFKIAEFMGIGQVPVIGDVAKFLDKYVLNDIQRYIVSGVASVLSALGVSGIVNVNSVVDGGDYFDVDVDVVERIEDPAPLVILAAIIGAVLITYFVSQAVIAVSNNQVRIEALNTQKKITDDYKDLLDRILSDPNLDAKIKLILAQYLFNAATASIKSASLMAPSACDGLKIGDICVPWWAFAVGLVVLVLLAVK